MTQRSAKDPRIGVPEEIPQPFREIAQHCLNPNPVMRWTAAQVLTKLTAAEAAPPLPARDLEEDHSGKRVPNWIYAALAALVLLVFIVAALRKKEPAEHVRVPPRVAAQAPLASPAPVTPSIAPSSQPQADGWSVIAAAYGSREPAETRARAIAKRWPRFHSSVSRMQTGKAHYVVVLGENLSQDAAKALRNRAVAAGLPRDTYISKN
jgi:hypothetical protein